MVGDKYIKVDLQEKKIKELMLLLCGTDELEIIEYAINCLSPKIQFMRHEDGRLELFVKDYKNS